MNIKHIIGYLVLTVLTIPFAFADDSSVTDTQIINNVKMQIAADNLLQDLNIIVTSQNGVVTLDGVVYSQNQLNEAIQDAQSVSGVQNVVSEIVIVPEDS